MGWVWGSRTVWGGIQFCVLPPRNGRTERPRRRVWRVPRAHTECPWAVGHSPRWQSNKEMVSDRRSAVCRRHEVVSAPVTQARVWSLNLPVCGGKLRSHRGGPERNRLGLVLATPGSPGGGLLQKPGLLRAQHQAEGKSVLQTLSLFWEECNCSHCAPGQRDGKAGDSCLPVPVLADAGAPGGLGDAGRWERGEAGSSDHGSLGQRAGWLWGPGTDHRHLSATQTKGSHPTPPLFSSLRHVR